MPAHFFLQGWVELESKGGPARRCLVLSVLVRESLGTWSHFTGSPFRWWPEGEPLVAWNLRQGRGGGCGVEVGRLQCEQGWCWPEQKRWSQGFPPISNPHAKGFSAVSMVPVLPPRGGRAQDGGGSFKSVALRRWDGQRSLDECEAKSEHGEWERSEKVRKVS